MSIICSKLEWILFERGLLCNRTFKYTGFPLSEIYVSEDVLQNETLYMVDWLLYPFRKYIPYEIL